MNYSSRARPWITPHNDGAASDPITNSSILFRETAKELVMALETSVRSNPPPTDEKASPLVTSIITEIRRQQDWSSSSTEP
jgi:hypothetical protein